MGVPGESCGALGLFTDFREVPGEPLGRSPRARVGASWGLLGARWGRLGGVVGLLGASFRPLGNLTNYVIN